MPDPNRLDRGTRTALIGIAVAVLVLGTLAFVVGRLWGQNTPPPIPPRERCVATVGDQTADLELEQAYYAAIIAGVANQRGLPPRAVSIALATALQESGLRNIDYGDRDSIGLFQQRPSQGWGTVEQIMNPQYSAGKFYDALVKIPDWQNGDINDVAQAVQRSGVPDGYRKHIERAKILGSALSGETPAAFSCLIRGTGTADPATFADLVKATYGGTAPATTSGQTITVTTASDRTTWAVAAAAQAWASYHGIRQVSVGNRTWVVSGSTLGPWATATPGPDRAVRIGF